MKKSFRMIVMAVALVMIVFGISALATAAMPAPPQSGNPPQGGMTPPEGIAPPSGEMGQKPQNDGQGRQGGMSMLDAEAVEDAIDGVADSTAKANLTTLLASYSKALEAEKAAMDKAGEGKQIDESCRTAVENAKTALIKALTAAGVDTDKLTRQGGTGMNGGMLPVDVIEDAVDALSASTEKTNLTTLLAAYSKALEAEKTAMEAAGEGKQIDKSYRTAVENAKTALVTALESAGIDADELMKNSTPPEKPANTATKSK